MKTLFVSLKNGSTISCKKWSHVFLQFLLHLYGSVQFLGENCMCKGMWKAIKSRNLEAVWDMSEKCFHEYLTAWFTKKDGSSTLFKNLDGTFYERYWSLMLMVFIGTNLFTELKELLEWSWCEKLWCSPCMWKIIWSLIDLWNLINRIWWIIILQF